ncbi:MAG TPA: zinc ribbon domain-containing protein [Nannocystis exedens]|nr:zinc ribbon domain-containing protein [Nannocystis exedens]
MTSSLVHAALITVGGVALFVVLVVLGGANVEAATIGLAFSGMMLLYALRRLFLVAAALGRGDAPVIGLGRVSKSELRDEKRRLLRAIKELEFDYGMRKLSKQDFESVSAAYKMRAIEVMRALDGSVDLHPQALALLRGQVEEPGVAASFSLTVPGQGPGKGAVCASCATANENDARFCKHCGTALEHA